MNTLDALGITLVLLIGVYLLGSDMRRRRAENRKLLESTEVDKHVWTGIRQFGGAKIYTPEPMTELEATAWIAKNAGPVMYVDRDMKFIFYRAVDR